MGSPLAPVLASIFMHFNESKWLNEYSFNKPKFYLRRVNSILAAFGKEQDSLNFLDFLNKRHPNIKFTIEKQNLTLQTYQKLTYTGLLLGFRSFTSFSYEISLIKRLVDRLKFVTIGALFIMT